MPGSFLVLAAALLLVDSVAGEELRPAAMLTAVEYVAAGIERIHPKAVGGLPAEVAAAVEDARRQVAQPLDEERLFFVLSELLVSLKDAHSRVEKAPPRAIPGIRLPLTWLEEGWVVNQDTNQLRRGDALRTLGGRSAAELMLELRKIVPAENSQHLRSRGAEVLVRADYLEHLGLVGANGEVALRIERDGVERSVGLSLGEQGGADEDVGDDWIGFSIDPRHSLGVLRLDRCLYSDRFTAMLDQFLSAVAGRGIRRIAVDLRRNRGGDVRVAFAFMSYLKAEYDGFSVFQRASPEFLDQYQHFDHDGLRGVLRAHGVNPAEESFLIPGKALMAMMSQLLREPKAAADRPAFSGEIYLLTSPMTFSSANLFATLVQDNRVGKILGEPTGNEVNFHGQPVYLPIPGTEFRLRLATSQNIRPDSRRANQPAVLPDIFIPTSRRDVQLGNDPQLEWLRRCSPDCDCPGRTAAEPPCHSSQ